MTHSSAAFAGKSSTVASDKLDEGAAANGAVSRNLVGAEWSPDGKTVIIAHGSALSTLHMTAEPPSLDAQVLPVLLSEVSFPHRDVWNTSIVGAIAWDSRGQRLAIAVRHPHPAAGSVILYDTQCDPILTTRCIGYIKVPLLVERDISATVARDASQKDNAEGLEDWEVVEAETDGDESGNGGVDAIERAREMFVGLSFCGCFDQGAALSVRKENYVATVPMYFAA